MDIKYSDFLEVCKAFYKLPKHAFLVFDYLSENNDFCGTYTELANNVGIDISNACKACKQLENMGVITILSTGTKSKLFFVHNEWYKNLMKNSDLLPGFKAETYKRKKGKK
jgi:hypothetical protein